MFFRLWGVPFILIGIYLLIGRFLYDMWLRQDTYYGVTNFRILIQSGIFGRSLKSISLTNLPEIILTRKESGRGTISFGQDKTYGESQYTAPKFEMISDVRNVHQLIFDARQKCV